MTKRQIIHNGKTYKLVSFRKTKEIAKKAVEQAKKKDAKLYDDLKKSYKIVPHQNIYLIYVHSTLSKKFMKDLDNLFKK